MSLLRQSFQVFSSVLQKTASNAPSQAMQSVSQPSGILNMFVRTNIRVHFPRPCERKRVKRHGWLARISTPGGRRILMRRILRGRWILSH